MLNKELFCLIFKYVKQYWYIGVIILLIIMFVFKETSSDRLFKEYKKQIKESEKIIKNHENDIKIIDGKIDSLQNLFNKLSEKDKEIEKKTDEVTKKGKKKIDDINKEDNPNSLIEEYKKTIKKHEKD
jgi:peptidoglycan hydrolase CwlO-like protein